MRDPVAHQRAVGRITRLWRCVAYLGVPVACAGILLARSFADFRIEFGVAPQLGGAVIGVLAALAVAAVLGARMVGNRMLQPAAMAERARTQPAAVNADASPLARAEAQILAGLFLQAAILDFPGILLLMHSLAFNTDLSAWLAIGYCVLVFTVMRPDIDRLLRETVRRMERVPD